MTKPLLLAATLLALTSGVAKAQDKPFFDTSEPDKLLTFGARLGVNTSNATVDGSLFNLYDRSNWGTGIDLGFVASINLRDYLSIQPGVFINVRNGSQALFNADYSVQQEAYVAYVACYDHRDVELNIPIVASGHFNVTDDVRVSADFGPYFGLRMGGSKDRVSVGKPMPAAKFDRRKSSFGFKMGAGINVLEHYYFGIHYYAQCTKAWTQPYNGRAKMWSFTLGYDF